LLGKPIRKRASLIPAVVLYGQRMTERIRDFICVMIDQTQSAHGKSKQPLDNLRADHTNPDYDNQRVLELCNV
jgi:hypothetical protein